MRIPKLTLHKPTGQARVIIRGRHVYCGLWGSPEAERKYLAELQRIVVAEPAPLPPVAESVQAAPPQSAPRSVETLAAAYVQQHCRTHYRHADGSHTSELNGVLHTLRDWIVKQPEGRLPIDAFGPRALKCLRARMIDAGLCRRTINRYVGRIVRMFRWGASEEYCGVQVYQALRTVPQLARGRSPAAEHEPVGPVAWELVAQTLPHLPDVVQRLVKVQWETGSRGSELFQMRLGDLDRSGAVWRYRVRHHKTSWRGAVRTILLGATAQSVIEPLLVGLAADDLVFTRDGLSRRRRAGVPEAFDANSYQQQIRKATRRAGCQHWHPHRLRHSYATRVRAAEGVEVAQVLLGQSCLSATEVYAESDMARAVQVVERLG